MRVQPCMQRLRKGVYNRLNNNFKWKFFKLIFNYDTLPNFSRKIWQCRQPLKAKLHFASVKKVIQARVWPLLLFCCRELKEVWYKWTDLRKKYKSNIKSAWSIDKIARFMRKIYFGKYSFLNCCLIYKAPCIRWKFEFCIAIDIANSHFAMVCKILNGYYWSSKNNPEKKSRFALCIMLRVRKILKCISLVIK